MPSGAWSTYDYASYYALGNAPTVNLTQYRTLAQSSCAPNMLKKTGGGFASPESGPGGCDSGVYLSTKNTSGVKFDKNPGDYVFSCSTCVFYIDADADLPNNAWLDVKALIVTGNVDFNAKNTLFVTTVPANAGDEYQYAPDAVNHWTTNGWTNGGTTNIANCGMHGFLYVGGSVSNAGGNSIIVGAIFIVGGITANTMTVYYDSGVGNNILFQSATIARVSWDEIRTTW
jgi:hypothetical protein